MAIGPRPDAGTAGWTRGVSPGQSAGRTANAQGPKIGQYGARKTAQISQNSLTGATQKSQAMSSERMALPKPAAKPLAQLAKMTPVVSGGPPHATSQKTAEASVKVFNGTHGALPGRSELMSRAAPPPPSYSPQPPTSGKATTTHQGGWTGNTKVNLTSEQSQALMDKYQEKRSENNPRDAKAIQEFNSKWDDRLKSVPPSFKGRPGSSGEFLALPREEQIKAHADYFQKEAAACKLNKSPDPSRCPDAKWEKLSYLEKKIEFANITVIKNQKAAEAETTLADFLGGARVAFTDREKDLLKSEIARIPSLLGRPPVTLTPTEYKKLTPEGQVQAHAKYLIDRDNFARSPQLPRELHSEMSQKEWESVSPSIRGGLFHTMNKSETDKRLPAIEGQFQFDYTAPPPDHEGYFKESVNVPSERTPIIADFTGGAKVALSYSEKDVLKNEFAENPKFLRNSPANLTSAEYKSLTPEGQVQAHARYLNDRDKFVHSRNPPPQLNSVDNPAMPMSQKEWESFTPSQRKTMFNGMNMIETQKRLAPRWGGY